MSDLKPQPRERAPQRAEDAALIVVVAFLALLAIAGVGGLIVAAIEVWAVCNG